MTAKRSVANRESSPWVLLWAPALFLSLMAACYGSVFAGNPAIFGPDGFFHYRMASLMAEKGQWWLSIDSLPYTVLGESGPDHQWLFHVLLMPFTLWGDEIGYLLAASAMAALPATAIYLVLRDAKVPMPWFFAGLAFLSSPLVLIRYLQIRSQSLAVIFIVLLLFAMVRQQYARAMVLAALFLASYHGATVMLPMLMIALAVLYREQRTLDLRLVIAMSVGVLLALLVSPWFPANVEYLLFHVLSKVRTPLQGMIGLEWGGIYWRDIWRFGWIVLTGTAMAVLLVSRKKSRLGGRLSAESLAFILASVLCFAMMISSARFIEYWVPLNAIALGLVARDYRWLDSESARFRHVRSTVCAVLVLAMAFWHISGLPQDPPVRTYPSEYAGEAAYIHAHGSAGELIFNTRWSDYQILFYQLPDRQFVNGLDGHYLAYADPQRFNVWYRVLANAVPADMDVADFIGSVFPARWIIISAEDAYLLDIFERSPRILLRHASGRGWLFEVLPEAQ